MQNEKLIEKLNAKFAFVRKSSLAKLKKREQSDNLLVPDKNLHEVNLNIHTNNSFSPYSATLAAYMAYKSGIKVACDCDYGTLTGKEEFAYACDLLEISRFSGFEVTLRRKNGKECLVAFYGLTPESIEEFMPKLASFREVCITRVKNVCDKINKKLKKLDFYIDFNKEVLSFVKVKKGTTLTLKHLFMATALKLIEKFGRGRALAEILRTNLCLDIEEQEYNLLCDANNPFYVYDLISALRHNFSQIDGGLTPPEFSEYLEIANKHGIAIAYEYTSPNNWLKNQTDTEKTLKDFSKMVDELKAEGFNAVCISALNLNEDIVVAFTEVLKKKEMLAIYTVKTEYPRNRFDSYAPGACREYLELSAYAILGSVTSMKSVKEDGFFSQKSEEKCPDFNMRLAMFAQIGRSVGKYGK